MDEIYDPAAQARRRSRPPPGRKKAPAARPGGLRDKVLGHLRDHPGASFTHTRSTRCSATPRGPIADALGTLVKLGDAELASEKPRKFRLVGTATASAQVGGAGDDGELTGAA